MGGAAIAMGVIAGAQLVSGYVQGESAKDAADKAAENTRMAAEATVKQINQEYQDTLSMQQTIFGSQGRILEGSPQSVLKGDRLAMARDVEAVRAGSDRTASAQRQAGKDSKNIYTIQHKRESIQRIKGNLCS